MFTDIMVRLGDYSEIKILTPKIVCARVRVCVCPLAKLTEDFIINIQISVVQIVYHCYLAIAIGLQQSTEFYG